MEGEKSSEKKKKISEEEKEKCLVGYIELPKEDYDNIKEGCHIRYIAANNDFKLGGKINGKSTEGSITIKPEVGKSYSLKLINTKKVFVLKEDYNNLKMLIEPKSYESKIISNNKKDEEIENFMKNADSAFQTVANIVIEQEKQISDLKKLIDKIFKYLDKISGNKKDMKKKFNNYHKEERKNRKDKKKKKNKEREKEKEREKSDSEIDSESISDSSTKSYSINRDKSDTDSSLSF